MGERPEVFLFILLNNPILGKTCFAIAIVQPNENYSDFCPDWMILKN